MCDARVMPVPRGPDLEAMTEFQRFGRLDDLTMVLGVHPKLSD